MHRFTLLLLPFLGALTLPFGTGRAEPRTGTPVTGQNPNNPARHSRSDVGSTRAESVAGGAKKSPVGETSPKAAAVAGEAHASSPGDAPSGKKTARSTPSPSGSRAKAAPAWTRGQPGVVKLVRGAETLEVRVLDRKQRLVPATLPQFARFLRAKSGADHPIDARLVTLVATVSDHFGGREVDVVSGFRPYSARQYSRHSNHNEGRAIDFSIKGIANEAVRDFCRTLRNVGVGFYPNSLFVHLDVRDGNAYWVDYAAPGQAPRYRPADGKSDDDDEGDAVATVDGGSIGTSALGDTPRADVARGHSAGPSGDRGVFLTR